jgi:hypothetical protein
MLGSQRRDLKPITAPVPRLTNETRESTKESTSAARSIEVEYFRVPSAPALIKVKARVAQQLQA